MVFNAFLWRVEIAKLFVRTIIIMYTIWQTFLNHRLLALIPEEVVTCLCKIAVSPSAFKCHLSENNRRWNAILALLPHCNTCIFLEELCWSHYLLLVQMQSFDGFLLSISYIYQQVIWVLKFPSKSACYMKMRS